MHSVLQYPPREPGHWAILQLKGSIFERSLVTQLMRYEFVLKGTHQNTFCLKHTQLLNKTIIKKGYFFGDKVEKCRSKLKLHSETASPSYISLPDQ